MYMLHMAYTHKAYINMNATVEVIEHRPAAVCVCVCVRARTHVL